MTFRVPLYLDLTPDIDSFAEDVRSGLGASPKSLPSKYFYDARGSQLFDAICELDEYYPTRTEMGILEENLEHISGMLGSCAILVEYGSGSSLKTRMLLGALPDAEAYVPIDISRSHLLNASEHIRKMFPALNVLPVCADYSQQISLDLVATPGSRVTVYFPGSTIGNFERQDAVAFLRRIHSLVGPGGGLLIGVDLVKDIDVLTAAYDDASGVTASFNRNILMHINARLAASFDPNAFDHEARWNAEEQRIEMHLISQVAHDVGVGDQSVRFEEGESILTEYSHKYTLESFASMAAEAGFQTERIWTDERSWFSIQYLTAIG